MAKYENQIRAQKEGLSNLNYYNNFGTDIIINLNSLFPKEIETTYFNLVKMIIENDQLFLTSINAIKIIIRANLLHRLGLNYTAIRDYDLVLSNVVPDSLAYAKACFSKSLILNSFGDFKNGLELYESRLKTDEQKGHGDEYPCPRYKGESIDEVNRNGKLLIYSEQGIGDSIMAIRYAIFLKKLGFDILVLNDYRIDNFLTFNLKNYGISCVVQDLEETLAYKIPMMSLPYVIGIEDENIPFTSQYLITSEEYKKKWFPKIKRNNKLNVGVVWESVSKTKGSKIRNIHLEKFKHLFDLDVNFYCLQKEINNEDKVALKEYNNVHYYQDSIDDFFDTSAIIEHLDLVISVDTSVAHLSAAMGKPTWILISYVPDFRWLLEREDSIWYDSVRLFRQDLDYDWLPVIHRIKEQLEVYSY